VSGLPLNWARSELKDLAEVHYGKSLPEKNRNLSGKVPVLGSSGIVGTHDRAQTAGKCIVIGRKGAAGSVHLVQQPCWPIDTAYFFQTPVGLDIQWLAYFLGSQQLSRLDKSTAIPSLSRDDLYREQIPIPPINEQTRIVAKLEELLSDLDAGVAELKAAQKKLAQYRQSLLKAAVDGSLTAEWRRNNPATETGAELLERILKERRARWEAKQLAKFNEQSKTPPKDWQKKYPEPVQPNATDLPELPTGWVWATVDQVAEVFLGKMLDAAKHTSGTKLPYLRNINVRWGQLDTSDLLEMYFKNEELGRYSLLDGDVLICEGGEPGRAAVYRKHPFEIKYQKALHRARLFGLYEPEFLVSYLEHSAKNGKLSKSFTGSTIKHLTKESFLLLAVPVPPQCEQSKIVLKLQAAATEIKNQNRAIDLSLRQSTAQRQNILRAAFAGQLVPQDPNDEPASALLERIRAERAAQAKPKARGRKTKETNNA